MNSKGLASDRLADNELYVMSNDNHPIRIVVRASELVDEPEVRDALRAKLKVLLKQAASDAQRVDAEAGIEFEISQD